MQVESAMKTDIDTDSWWLLDRLTHLGLDRAYPYVDYEVIN